MKLEVKWMNITTFLDCRIHKRRNFLVQYSIREGQARDLKLVQFVEDMKSSFRSSTK